MKAEDPEALYDQYLDNSLVGDPEAPAEFFARHPGVDTHGRERIETLYDVLTGAGRDEEQGDRPPFEKIAGFRLLRRIGSGSMGSVYLAEQSSLNRLVALKILRPELAASRSAMKRFNREARVIAKLAHPNVVKVHELGEENGTHFIAMELVPGRTLDELFKRGRPTLERTLTWVGQCARGLQAAHEQGIVHRDVKPSNILITPDDRAILCDFGMAHLTSADATRLTQTFAGSPSYAAPEQVDSKDGVVDGRTDVYGLGATLYEALTQRLPFDGRSLEEIFHKILRDEPQLPRRFHPELPPDVETVTLKAMAKRPRDRYESAGAMADDLRRVAREERIVARPPSVWAQLRSWARRRPAQAATVGTLVGGLVLIFSLAAWLIQEEANQRREEASQILGVAHDNVATYRKTRREHRALIQRHLTLSKRTQDSFLSEEGFRELDVVSVQVDDLRYKQQATFYETMEMLRRAEKLDPNIKGTDRLRAEFYVERMEEAFDAEDHVGAELFRELVQKHDPTGELKGPERAAAGVTLRSEPTGAAVYLFRDTELHLLGGTHERRMIPAPWVDGEPSVPEWMRSGGFALRVRADKEPLRRGDLIVKVNGHGVRRSLFLREPFQGLPRGAKLKGFESIAGLEELDAEPAREFEFDQGTVTCLPLQLPVAAAASVARDGGLAAEVIRDGETIQLTLPVGSDLRTTATPLMTTPANRVGTTPLQGLELTPGAYRVVLRHPKRPDQLLTFHLTPGQQLERSSRMPRAGDGPDGFIPIPSREPFWIMEREVTCAEFLTFLHATGHQAHWKKDAEGRHRIDDDWRLDWPAIAVTYHDAQAYAKWKGDGYALPTRAEWTFAANGFNHRTYVFGNVWRPRWAKSCYARPRALPESGMRYPIDESVFGVYDLTGSVAEWVDHWFDEGRGLKWAAGSSWGFADAQLFKVWGGTGASPGSRSDTIGFRLVWRPAKDAPRGNR
ncbi:MAG: protein kinase domain-containing protein [Planctomycetota bacterium]